MQIMRAFKLCLIENNTRNRRQFRRLPHYNKGVTLSLAQNRNQIIEFE